MQMDLISLDGTGYASRTGCGKEILCESVAGNRDGYVLGIDFVGVSMFFLEVSLRVFDGDLDRLINLLVLLFRCLNVEWTSLCGFGTRYFMTEHRALGRLAQFTVSVFPGQPSSCLLTISLSLLYILIYFLQPLFNFISL